MRNVVIAVAIIGLFLAGVWIVRKKVGDVRPALLPPKEDITKIQDKQSVGETPEFPLKLPEEFKVGIFAQGLGNARDLEFSTGGVLLVSIPASGKIVALPDKDQNGVADEVRDVVLRLDRPHGIAFYKDKLFIAEETRIVRYKWDENTLTAAQDKVLFSLPKGDRHFTRTISFNQKGQMFVSIGSTCDVCFEKNEWLAAVIVSDGEGTNPRLWAKGLRNSVFITVNSKTNELWGTEMGRDGLGDNLPPDEINIIRDGNPSAGSGPRDYGWPICYGNRIPDTNFQKGTPCEATEAPVYEIPAHSAPLGLTFVNSSQFPKEWQGDLLVSYHGSWNRSIPIGYKVVRLDVDGNNVRGEEDFLSGFLSGSQALGRPVDLIFDSQGSLYISDDKAGVVYKVIKE